MEPTYRLVEGGLAITCLICGRTSWNKKDVEYKYCGYCHKFHDDRFEAMDTIVNKGLK
jgi:ribosomal protein L37E